jgi:hypothetical protein
LINSFGLRQDLTGLLSRIYQVSSMDFAEYRVRGRKATEKAKLRITQPSSWKLEKQESSIAPANVWTNAGECLKN